MWESWHVVTHFGMNRSHNVVVTLTNVNSSPCWMMVIRWYEMLCHDSCCVQVPLHFPCCSEAKSFGLTVRYRRSQITGALQHRTWVEVSVRIKHTSSTANIFPYHCSDFFRWHGPFSNATVESGVLRHGHDRLRGSGTMAASVGSFQSCAICGYSRCYADTRKRLGWLGCKVLQHGGGWWLELKRALCNCGVMGYEQHTAQPHPILVCFRLMKSCTSSDDAYPQVV